MANTGLRVGTGLLGSKCSVEGRAEASEGPRIARVSGDYRIHSGDDDKKEWMFGEEEEEEGEEEVMVKS